MSHLKHSVLIISLLLGTINVFTQVIITADKTESLDSMNIGFVINQVSDTITIDSLDVPNVFTPNVDGYNDYFVVKTNGINLYEFSVYARSGMLVYKSETAVINWDGRSLAGHILRPGVYYYVIRQIDGAAPLKKTGFVQIIYNLD
ncbi:MAG: gliding motility-associated C-terminal domain-containing protein [Bacteroidales bacterium]|nr:gliding motility-associated C-terminal domain-containing protein [Bacteroidales bacterium]